MTHTANAQAVGKAVTGSLLAVYLIVVAFVVFWPTPIDRGFDLQLLRFAGWIRSHGMVWLSYDHVEFVANILMFVPLGVGLTLLLPRAMHWLVPLLGLFSSVVIEVVQAIALPDRFGGPMDVLSNTIGAALGWAATLIVRFAVSRRRGEKLYD